MLFRLWLGYILFSEVDTDILGYHQFISDVKCFLNFCNKQDSYFILLPSR